MSASMAVVYSFWTLTLVIRCPEWAINAAICKTDLFGFFEHLLVDDIHLL